MACMNSAAWGFICAAAVAKIRNPIIHKCFIGLTIAFEMPFPKTRFRRVLASQHDERMSRPGEPA
jgi:hypothetical protein